MSDYIDYGWGDGVTDAHCYLYPVLRGLLSKRAGKKILDIGCGNGNIANRLIDEGFCVYGIDASVTGIDIASAKKPGRFYLHDVSNSNLPSALAGINFDIIISTEVIEHLYAPRRYMELVSKTLHPGGIVILSTPYHGYLKNLAISLANGWDKHFTVLWDGGHIKFWSYKTLRDLLHEFGFSVLQFKGCGRVPFLWKSMFICAQKN